MDISFDEAISLLQSPRSKKRRQGAKVLRRLKRVEAGPFLLEALKKEVNDPRTWETQYHMIMALGECGYEDSLPFLHELAQWHREAAMVFTALGDAIVRLSRRDENDIEPVLNLLETGNFGLIDGAFRAMAMLRLKGPSEAISKIIDFAEGIPKMEACDVGGLWFWVAVAAAGWNSQKAKMFLEHCARAKREDVASAARAALKGTYLKCNPL